MAHHLASRLIALELLEGDAHAAAEREVADLILQLWERRHRMPFVRDPLGAVDEVERALARLDPETQGPFSYFRPFGGKPGPSEAEIELNSALKLAISIDGATAELVRSLFRYAGTIALDHDAEWVSAARTAHPPTIRHLSRLLDMDSTGSVSQPQEEELARIVQRARELGKLLRKISHLRD